MRVRLAAAAITFLVLFVAGMIALGALLRPGGHEPPRPSSCPSETYELGTGRCLNLVLPPAVGPVDPVPRVPEF